MTSLLVVAVLAAAPLNVGPDFQGFEQTFALKTDSDLGKKGMNDCGFSQTTSAPVLSFVVAGKPDGLVLELTKTVAGAVLTRGRQHLCLEPGSLRIDDAGTYELYLLDHREHPYVTNARVRLYLERVAAKQSAASVSTRKVPVLPTGPNPIRVKFDPKAPEFAPEVAGVPCAKVRVQPVAQLVVSQASRYRITGVERDRFVVRGDECLELEEAVDLEAGAWALWMEVFPHETELVITDTERGMDLATSGEAPRVKLASLPAAVRVKAAKEQARDAYAPCEQGARTPSFVIEPGEGVTFHLRAAGGFRDVSFDVFGDGGDECGKDSLELTDATRSFVFVSAPEAREVVVVMSDGKGVRPFWSPAEVPSGLPIDQRVVSFHYPFWRDSSASLPPALPLFVTAPAGLFVFLTKPINDVPVNEPLLLISHDGRSAGVLRANGSVESVRASVVTHQLPADLSFPKLKVPAPAKTTDEAWSAAGPLETARVDAWLQVEAAWKRCIHGYMAKHDPAWNLKNVEFYYVRSGLNVSDVVYGNAKRACHEAKFKKDGEAFIKAINASQAKLVTTLPDVLRSRLKR